MSDYDEDGFFDTITKIMDEKGLVTYTPKGMSILRTDIDISDMDGTIEHYKNGGVIYGVPLELTKPYWTRRFKNWMRGKIWHFNHSDNIPEFFKYKLNTPSDWDIYPCIKIWIDKDHRVIRFNQEHYW